MTELLSEYLFTASCIMPSPFTESVRFFMEGVACFADFSILAMVLDIEVKSFLAFSMSATSLIASFAMFAMRR